MNHLDPIQRPKGQANKGKRRYGCNNVDLGDGNAGLSVVPCAALCKSCVRGCDGSSFSILANGPVCASRFLVFLAFNLPR